MSENVIDFQQARKDKIQTTMAVALSAKVCAIVRDAVAGGLDPVLASLTLFRDALAAAEATEHPNGLYTLFFCKIEGRLQ